MDVRLTMAMKKAVVCDAGKADQSKSKRRLLYCQRVKRPCASCRRVHHGVVTALSITARHPLAAASQRLSCDTYAHFRRTQTAPIHASISSQQ